MKQLHMPLLLTLGLTLAACAPTVRGVDNSSPLLATSAFSPAEVAAGKTTFVQYTYPQKYIGVDDSRFDTLNVDFDQRTVTVIVNSAATAAPWLRLKVQDLPEGWGLELSKAEVVKEVVSTTNSEGYINIGYYPRIRVTYKVTAPTATRSGLARLQFLDEDKPLAPSH